jgi:hypothetical protein
VPIVYKGLSGIELMAMLDVPQDDRVWLDDHSFKITVFATEIRFANPDIAASIPCKVAHLSELKQGVLGDLAMKAMRMSVAGAIKQLRKKVGDEPGDGGPVSQHAGAAAIVDHLAATLAGPMEAGVSAGIMGMLGKNKPVSQPAFTEPGKVASSPKAWALFPANKLTSAVPVSLAKATQMYEPVKGSSGSSRYFLVGASQDLRIGCRYKGTSLSIRIEGVGQANYAAQKAKIAACGFTGVHDSYASMHLDVQDATTASKALGAILMGLGIKLETPYPDLSLLQNKGH